MKCQKSSAVIKSHSWSVYFQFLWEWLVRSFFWLQLWCVFVCGGFCLQFCGQHWSFSLQLLQDIHKGCSKQTDLCISVDLNGNDSQILFPASSELAFADADMLLLWLRSLGALTCVFDGKARTHIGFHNTEDLLHASYRHTATEVNLVYNHLVDYTLAHV